MTVSSRAMRVRTLVSLDWLDDSSSVSGQVELMIRRDEFCCFLFDMELSEKLANLRQLQVLRQFHHLQGVQIV